VVTCIGGMLITGFGFLNEICRTLVHQMISVHSATTACLAIVCKYLDCLITAHDVSVAHHNFATSLIHKQHDTGFRSLRQTSQTYRSTSPVLSIIPIHCHTPLERTNVLSDDARAFSGVPDSTCSYGGAFKMLQCLTDMIVKFWSS